MTSFEDGYEAPPDPVAEAKRNSVEGVAGFLAAASLFASLIALAYHPVPLAIASCLMALTASGMSVRHRTLCFAAVLVSAICFVGGMVIAIATGHPLW